MHSLKTTFEMLQALLLKWTVVKLKSKDRVVVPVKKTHTIKKHNSETLKLKSILKKSQQKALKLRRLKIL